MHMEVCFGRSCIFYEADAYMRRMFMVKVMVLVVL